MVEVNHYYFPLLVKKRIPMYKMAGICLSFIVLIKLSSCAQNNHRTKPIHVDNIQTVMKTDTATFGAGCFWCVEAVFQQLNGVISVESGYSGGHTRNPTYKEVCTGTTGHAEACQIIYDPSAISFTELLEVFWKTHDPTTLNRQGGDIGTQYRSVIFFHTEAQRSVAEEMKASLTAAHIWKDPLVTEIVPFREFFKAEDYHQEYYFQNTAQPYCSVVITPKLEKFRKVFADKLKK
jgi:peptide-methionine (S)-S-oxide reductase